MPLPVVDNAHVAEGVALLTSRYRKLPNISGLATALMLRMQEAENQLQSLISGMILANHPMMGGPWSILDQLGALVGAPRNGMNDVDYLAAIKLEIRVNRSNGLAEDVIQVLRLATGNSQLYLDAPPAGFIVAVFDLASPLFLAALLTRVRSAGTYGNMLYTTWSPGNDFILDSSVSHLSSAGVFGSSVSGGGSLLASVVPV